MSKKEVAKINLEIERNKKHIIFINTYNKAIRAVKDLVSVADDCAKRGFEHSIAMEHLETLKTIYGDATSLLDEGYDYAKHIELEIDALTADKEELEADL